MWHNSFGSKFKISIWGASHAPEVGVRIDGVPAGIALSEADFEADLSRRRASAKGTTARHEADIPTIRTGVISGKTTGEAIEIVFQNGDVRSSDYSQFEAHPRPSHVDFTARAKYGDEVDLRGSGQFSGRMTVLLVAAGVVAKKVVEGVQYSTSIAEIGGSRNTAEFSDIIAAAMANGDSVGGVVECIAKGVKAGLGEPFFDSAESIIAHLLFSIPAVKGVEFGSGFEGVRLRGSERNDCFVDGEGHTATNNEGGINGGITNGNDLIVRVAIKPTPSISCEQMTYNRELGEIAPLRIKGRHDACIALRAAVVVESAVAIALAELALNSTEN
ncbi:MAG: chorismate synthase [Alistipes sp.]|nr:chorismate synthase [Alistipes sp.]